jgi:hypothetical protein
MLPLGKNRIRWFGVDCDPHVIMKVLHTLIWSCLLLSFCPKKKSLVTETHESWPILYYMSLFTMYWRYLYWVFSYKSDISIGSFFTLSYQPSPGNASNFYFCLVWGRYKPDIENGIKLIQHWYYLRSLPIWY